MLLTINTTPKNISGIYKIIYPDGKIYVGQAINIRARLMEHHQRALGLSVRKKQKCDQELFNQNYYIDKYELLEEVKAYSLLDEIEKNGLNKNPYRPFPRPSGRGSRATIDTQFSFRKRS